MKWGVLSRLPRAALARIEQFLYWTLIGLGLVVLAVLAGLIPPPLGFLTQAPP